jgi:CheY-like chemotaxis protein
MSVQAIDPDDGARAGCLRVLLAEDHPTNRLVVEMILSQSGVAVTSVEDGLKAVDRFKTEQFDAIIMDLQMPVMDGLTAIRAIREFEAAAGFGRTPVHVLSTNSLPSDFAASIEAGADSHLTKPVNVSALLEAILNPPDGQVIAA